jgi:hypothetical protein
MTLDKTDHVPENNMEMTPAPEEPSPEIIPGSETEASPQISQPPDPMEVSAPAESSRRNENHFFLAFFACLAGLLLPGMGHALLRKWDRALVFLFAIPVMFLVGVQLKGQVFAPDASNLFGLLKFISNAGIGLIYWISRHNGAGVGDPAAYTYEYANTFLYVAGLLNMLVIVDAFDIAQGRKK